MTPLEGLGGTFAGALLASLRLLPTALLSPHLGGPLVPPPVRIGLALALGWAGHQAAGAPDLPLAGAALAAAAARELALGVALGMATVLPVEAARAGGRLADTLRGATLSELHVAPIRQREAATGDLLAQWCLLAAAWTGGDRLVLRGLVGTFSALPPGGGPTGELLASAGLRVASELVAAALALAAPAAAGILCADLALSLVERLAPGVAAARGAQPARAALGLAAVALAASAIGGRLVALVALAGRATHWATGGPP